MSFRDKLTWKGAVAIITIAIVQFASVLTVNPSNGIIPTAIGSILVGVTIVYLYYWRVGKDSPSQASSN